MTGDELRLWREEKETGGERQETGAPGGAGGRRRFARRVKSDGATWRTCDGGEKEGRWLLSVLLVSLVQFLVEWLRISDFGPRIGTNFHELVAALAQTVYHSRITGCASRGDW